MDNNSIFDRDAQIVRSRTLKTKIAKFNSQQKFRIQFLIVANIKPKTLNFHSLERYIAYIDFDVIKEFLRFRIGN